MTEEDSTEIFLSNVEPNDFARFCEYAYTGDYFVINEHFPLPTRVGTNLERKLEHEEQKMDGIDTNFSSISNPEYERAHATIGACNISTIYPKVDRSWRPPPDLTSPPLRFKRTERPRDRDGKSMKFAASSFKNEEQTLQLRHSRTYITFLQRNPNFDKSYTESFLAHARLYVFAHTYHVDLLRAVILGKLKQMFNGALLLSQLEAGSQTHLAMFAALVEYTYANTADNPNNPDPLRALVVDYAFADIKRLKVNDAFMELLGKGGSFTSALVRKTWKC